jgi:hypothetical protein
MEKPYVIEFEKIGQEEIGYLSIAENPINLPFAVKRVYWVYGTPEEVERGNHAHKEGVQLLVAVSGLVNVTLESQSGELSFFELASPSLGLYVPKMYWRKLNFKEKSVCMCLASTPYDPLDYIYDYIEFKKS